MLRHRYLYISHGILALFIGIMLVVITVAYMRRSGSTGLDMATIHMLRFDAMKVTSSLPEE